MNTLNDNRNFDSHGKHQEKIVLLILLMIYSHQSVSIVGGASS
jgi:hypothetical protein